MCSPGGHQDCGANQRIEIVKIKYWPHWAVGQRLGMHHKRNLNKIEQSNIHPVKLYPNTTSVCFCYRSTVFNSNIIDQVPNA